MQLPYQLIHHMIFKFHEEPSAKKSGEISYSYSMFLEFQIPLLSDVCAGILSNKNKLRSRMGILLPHRRFRKISRRN